MHLSDKLSKITGIGSKKESVFSKHGIESIQDLILFFPRTYLDLSKKIKIAEIQDSEWITIVAEILRSSIIGNYRNKRRLVVELWDGTQIALAVFFHNIDFFVKKLISGKTFIISGKPSMFQKRWQFIHPEMEILEEGKGTPLHTGRIVPIYSLSEEMRLSGISSRFIRQAIANIYSTGCLIPDPFYEEISKKNNFLHISDAIQQLHFPEHFDAIQKAERTIAFYEFLAMNIRLEKHKEKRKANGKTRDYGRGLQASQAFIQSLPFPLTASQEKVISEIQQDLINNAPMLRLLEGDVGSGKTVVALAAMILVAESGYQAALLAPTEILARQHFKTFLQLYGDHFLSVTLLIGGHQQDKEKHKQDIQLGISKIIIGTHSLLEKDISFQELGLIVIDEQHRFGVEQRHTIINKGIHTDCLLMTATPIPRSLSLSLFGEMELSILNEKPINRPTVQTLLFSKAKSQGVFNSIHKYLGLGQQVFWIYPIIEESETIDLDSAMKGYENLRGEIFPDTKICLLHGRLSALEKESVMQSFLNGYCQILVSTTVIEVGVDIANASIIVIEHPERFGLAQLHQLRGRVGRGNSAAFCILLLPENLNPLTKIRLEEFAKSNDGFLIAEMDLRLRGPGDFFGTRQHGLPNFRKANIVTHGKELLLSKEIAQSMDIKNDRRFDNWLFFEKTLTPNQNIPGEMIH